MALRNRELLEQVLVPGIIDYNNRFIEANQRTVQEAAGRHQRTIVNGKETVIMKMSDISSIYVEPGSSYLAGDSRTIIVTLHNKFRYTFTYETGNAIRLLWKRLLRDPGLGFSFENDRRALDKAQPK